MTQIRPDRTRVARRWSFLYAEFEFRCKILAHCHSCQLMKPRIAERRRRVCGPDHERLLQQDERSLACAGNQSY